VISVVSAALTVNTAAVAQNIFDTLIGVRPPPSATPVPPTAGTAGRPPLSITVRPQSTPLTAAGSTTAYCVRICDGRYFPLPRLASPEATPAKLCNSLCPTSRTKIYWGSTIERSVTSDHSRYLDLDTAFAFREALAANCTCNGKDVFGTAPISISADITLREGDVVAFEDGFYVFRGSRRDDHAAFTPANDYSALPKDLQAWLAAAEIGRGRATGAGSELRLRTHIIVRPVPAKAPPASRSPASHNSPIDLDSFRAKP